MLGNSASYTTSALSSEDKAEKREMEEQAKFRVTKTSRTLELYIGFFRKYVWPSGAPTVRLLGKFGQTPPVWICLPVIPGDVFGVEVDCHNRKDVRVRKTLTIWSIDGTDRKLLDQAWESLWNVNTYRDRALGMIDSGADQNDQPFA